MDHVFEKTQNDEDLKENDAPSDEEEIPDERYYDA